MNRLRVAEASDEHLVPLSTVNITTNLENFQVSFVKCYIFTYRRYKEMKEITKEELNL